MLKKLPDSFSPIKELEKFGRIRLIVFDIDGTFLKNPEKGMGSRIVQLFNSMRQSGVGITIATGRAYNGVKEIIKGKFRFSIPITLYNGGLVIDVNTDKIILHHKINNSVSEKIRAIIQENDASAIFYYVITQEESFIAEKYTSTFFKDELAVFYGSDEDFNNANEFNGISLKRWCSDFSLLHPTAVLVNIKSSDDKDILTDRLSRLSEISLTSSGKRFIEVRPYGSSKEHGVKLIAEHKKIDQSEIMAVGDNDNDIEILKWAGIGVAVSNSSESAFNACDYRADKGVEDAAINILDIIRRSKRILKR